MGIVVTSLQEDALTGEMPVNASTRQPLGLLHGGASCVLAETLGSTAANMCLDPKKFVAVGLDINANHVSAVKQGKVIGVAKPLHRGRSTHVWEIFIKNSSHQLVCISRLTMAIKTLKS